MASGKLLVEHGFIKKGSKDNYEFDKKREKYFHKFKDSPDENDADEEEVEETNLSSGNGYTKTGFPQPKKRYKFVKESFGESIEEVYFWILNHLQQDQGFMKVEKISDIFSASENSAFFGASQQRLGIQQDRAANFLRYINDMVKQLFQLLRELRIHDERLVLYDNFKTSQAADNTLKGLFIDMAEGGAKNPGSVIGLATQVNFTVLPDLFMNSRSRRKEDVDKEVDDMEFNNQVKSILKRKLYAYFNWVEQTHKELKARKKFTLQYLRQHWNVIRMYLNWVRPYLRNTQKLSMNEGQLNSPYLVNAFETSMTEIEILAYKKENKGFHPCILVTFEYRTKPIMANAQEYQRSPQHVGRVSVSLRAYAWSKDQIEAYKKMKNREDLEMLGLADQNVEAAMEALDEDLDHYLKEAGEAVAEERTPSQKPPEKKRFDWEHSAVGPFVEMFKGFSDIFQAFTGFDLTYKSPPKKSSDPSSAEKDALIGAFLVYKFFKKSHGMMSW
jgi:hypothetical protein